MSYVIFGRAVKNEYLTLGTLGAVFGAVAVSRAGKKKEEPKAQTLVEKVKEAVPIAAGSSEEEQFIQKFLEEAEKADSKH